MLKKLLHSLIILTAIAMIGHVIIYISFGIALIPFPFDYDQAEGFELNNAILLSQGQCPYCDNDVYPFYASGYAPVFHLVMVPFVWIFGAHFWYGRLIIFVATLVTAGSIGYAIWRDQRHLLIAMIAGAAFLASNFIYHIGPLLRQHLLMVMFETLAIVLLAQSFEGQQRTQRRRLLWGFLCLLLAGYTKQLAYSTCIAVALWLFLRQPRRSIVYSTGLIVVAALFFALGMLLTNGDWYVNLISSNQNAFIMTQLTGLAGLFVRLHYPLLLLAGLMLLYELYFSRLSIYSVWFVVSLISTVGAGKWGAGDSYYATSLVASCILAGLFVSKAVQGKWFVSKQALQHVVGLASIALLLIYSTTVIKLPTSGIYTPIADFLGVEPVPGHRYPLYDAATWTVSYAVTGHFPSELDYERGWAITERVRASEGIVISEDAGFVIQANREVVTNAVQLRNLWENGLYDPHNLLALIESQDISLIIRRADLFPIPVLEAIDRYYMVDEIVEMNGFAYELWVPQR